MAARTLIGLIATAFCIFVASSHAACTGQWFMMTNQGNHCVSVSSSPQDMIDFVASEGEVATSEVDHLTGGGLLVELHFTKLGQEVGGVIFFTAMTDCQKFVAAAIAAGNAPNPRDLK
jgi:hypothetical protein